MPSRAAAKPEGTPSNPVSQPSGSSPGTRAGSVTPARLSGSFEATMSAHDEHPPAPRPGLIFGSVAAAYDGARPGYPDDALAWLTPAEPATVLELGAGTGKLTAGLLSAGHQVIATDHSPAMLARLRDNHAEASGERLRVLTGAAESIPLPDRSVDLVIAGQAFHWFAPERALPEIARVLRPGGTVAVLWNIRDEQIPWVRKLGRILGEYPVGAPGAADLIPASEEERLAPVRPLVDSLWFGSVEQAIFRSWHTVTRDSLQDLARSQSSIAALDAAERDQVLGRIRALYDDYGRGPSGLQLPYLTACYRTTLVDAPLPSVTLRPLSAPSAAQEGDQAGAQAGAAAEAVPGPGERPSAPVLPGHPGRYSPGPLQPTAAADAGPDASSDDGTLLFQFR